jgi:hypothetical protein
LLTKENFPPNGALDFVAKPAFDVKMLSSDPNYSAETYPIYYLSG